MVYLHFPTNYTEEELMLQAKYQKLKRKVPKQDADKAGSLKRPIEAKDAKEVAKKLIKSGVISAIPKPDKQERTTFKRSTGFERKMSGADKALSGYQPFSATHPEDVVCSQKRVKNLYDSFLPSNHQNDRGEPDGSEMKSPYKPRQGNTIYIYGYSITEEILRRAFQTFGKILNISMEIEKKQPIIEPINDVSSSSAWSTIAASHSQKGSHRDKRTLVTYDEELF